MLDIRELMNLKEAYNAVYAPQELTEDQIWEEVETWVNSLIEEGYDLSDYTWEEMYESYLEEAPKTANLVPAKGVTAGGPVSLNKPYPSQLGGKKGEVTYTQNNNNSVRRNFRPFGSEANPPSAADARKAEADPRRNPVPAGSPPPRPAASSPTPAAASGPVLSKKGGVEGTGVGANFKAKAFADAEKSRYSSVATQNAARSSTPAATAAPRPAAATAAPKPATGILGKTSFERRTPTSAELKAAQAARAGGEKDPEKVLQAAKAASAPATGNTLSQTTAAASKPAAFSLTPAVTPAAKPTPTSKPTPAATGSKKPGSIVSSFDYFDAVKGYLIGEGYADTEEAALAIMINMSEEWKQSIIKSI